MRKAILIVALTLMAAPAAAQVRVGVANGGNMSGAAVVAQLNDDTHFDFEASIVAPGDIDSVDELAEYDVIIIGDSGHNDDGYTQAMTTALRTWVMDEGGAIVGSGWVDFSLHDNPIDLALDDVLPIDAVPFGYNFCGSGSTITIDQNEPHPITEGLPDSFALTTSNNVEYTHLPADEEDVVVLGSVSGGSCNGNSPRNVISAGEIGAGRSVYLGLLYMASANYRATDLRTGAPDQLLEQAVVWAAQGGGVGPRADGGTYEIEEGTINLTLNASRSRPRDGIVSYDWDLDGDGEYDDAQGVEIEINTLGLDGPGELLIGLQVQTVDNEFAEGQAVITIVNVGPTITSTPPDVASIGTVYTYEIEAMDPALELDPFGYELLEAPEGVTIDAEGVLTWTPGPDDFETEVSFHLVVDDGDGASDEQMWTLFITAPDEDLDRIPDEVDNCPSVPNPNQEDFDQDGMGDVCDDDDDNDEVLDTADNCPFIPNPGQEDNDVDGMGDVCDSDDDNDFITDDQDNCPTITNPSQSDVDNDGVGDACDDDRDLDGVRDEVDNCPDVPNLDQSDIDLDGIGDECDPDADGDGLELEREEELGTSDLDADSDDDGLTDGDEVDVHMTNPLSADSDDDELSDPQEIERGTDPNDLDTDDDGVLDGLEVQRGTDPLNPDSDDDGLNDGDEAELRTDPLDPDSDDGGVNDGDEFAAGTDPLNPADDLPDGNNGINNGDNNNGDNNGIFETNNGGPDTDESPVTDESCACRQAARPASTTWLQTLLRRR